MTSHPPRRIELIDIGVNFHSSQLHGLTDELLSRASEASVVGILATGTSLDASQRALALAQRHQQVWATAGIHPHRASDYGPHVQAELARLWASPRVVAVGECGLDYNRMYSPKDAQRHAFEAQLAQALQLDKPLFLHCRDAHDDFLAMLRDAAAAGARGVVHCFTDGPREAQAYLALGFDLGITGWVADPKRGGALRDAVKEIPLQRMHLETDAPYLRPRNARKTRSYNEPALLPFVAQAVAEIKGLDVAEVANHATANSRRLFRLQNIPEQSLALD